MRCARFIVPASLAALLATAGPALANPVYLSCVIVENGAPEKLEITADENTGTVSIFVPRTGASQSYRAAFSRDQVTFSDHVVLDYAISRTDLSITATRWMSGSVEKGKCEVAPPPKRAF